MAELEKPKKQIEVVVKYFYPVTAGIETNVMETYSVLAQLGWEVIIHTCKDIYTQKNILSDTATIKGLKIQRYAFGAFGFFPKINWSKTDLVCLHNFDIFPHFWVWLYSLILKCLKRKKFALILTPHGGFNPEWSIFSRPKALLKKIYHQTFGVFFINALADGVRAVSEWERAQLISKGIKAERIVVIGNGLEDEAFMDLEAKASLAIKEKVKQYGKYLIQIGRLYPIKNYETTIKALAKLPSDLNYVIVGPLADEKYKKGLEILIKSLGLESRVIFAGVVRGVDKYYLIKKAQLMVHLALWESFCNVVHEGLSQGLVCIVADNTALPYLIKDGVNGFCVETKNSEAVAEKISYVLENKNEPFIKEMEEKNRRYALRNSWREVAMKMESFYLGSLAKLLPRCPALARFSATKLGNFAWLRLILQNQTTKSFLIEVRPTIAKLKLLAWRILKLFIKRCKAITSRQGSFNILFIIFCSLMLILSIRGIAGNPTEQAINSDKWIENGPLETSADRGKFALTYSIVENHSLSFSLPLAKFATPDLARADGKYVSLFAPGISFLAIPGYLIGKAFGVAPLGAFTTIALFALLNVMLLRAIAIRLGAHPIAANIGAALFLFATPAFSYAVTLYQHHVSTFFVLLSIYALLRWNNFWSLTLVWFLCALSLIVDYPNLFLMLPIGIFALGRIILAKWEQNNLRIKIKPGWLLTLLAITVPFSFLLWYNSAANGSPFQLSGTLPRAETIDEAVRPVQAKGMTDDELTQAEKPAEEKVALGFFKTRHLLNGFYTLLISPDRGTIVYAPIILAGIVGFIFLYPRARRGRATIDAVWRPQVHYHQNSISNGTAKEWNNQKIGNLLIMIILVNFLLYSMWGDPYGGWAFGSRYLIPAYALLAIGLAVAITKLRKNHFFLITLVVVMTYSLWINSLGAVTTNLNPPQEEALALEKTYNIEVKYDYERNLQMLDQNKSKSFVWQTFVQKYLSAKKYHELISGFLITVILIMLLYYRFFFKNEKEDEAAVALKFIPPTINNH